MDLTGRTFGKLTVLGVAPKTPTDDRKYWLCRCTCGAVRKNQVTALMQGKSTTCGQSGCKNTSKPTHRASKTPMYKQWAAMRYRCENPNTTKYRYYGGKGITVCKRWQKYDNFLEDMGPRPSKRHSLDRIDSSKGYEPGNVVWATYAEQNAHLSPRTHVTINGQTHTTAQWARLSGINVRTIQTRRSRGWPDERLLDLPTTPYQRGQNHRRNHQKRLEAKRRESSSELS